MLYGSIDGASWATIFDSRSGIWQGGGFFVANSDTAYFSAKADSVTMNGAPASAVSTGSGGSTSITYTYVPDYGYVSNGGSDMNWSTAEYFMPGVGPWGYTNHFSTVDSSYQSSTTDTVSLEGSSLLGDAQESGVPFTVTVDNTLGLSLTVSAQALPSAGWLYGSASSSDAVTGVTWANGDGTTSSDNYQDIFEIPNNGGSVDLEVNRLPSSWDPFEADVFSLYFTSVSGAGGKKIYTAHWTLLAQLTMNGRHPAFGGGWMSWDTPSTATITMAGTSLSTGVTRYLFAVKTAGTVEYRLRAK